MRADAEWLNKVQNEPFAIGYLTCESECTAMKIASGLYQTAASIPLSINLSHGLCGLPRYGGRESAQPGIYFSFGDGISVKDKKIRKKPRSFRLSKSSMNIFRIYLFRLEPQRL